MTFLPGESSVIVPVRTVGGLVGDRTVDLSLAQLPGAVPTAATISISGVTGRSTTTGGLGSIVGTGSGPGGSLSGLPGGTGGTSGGTTVVVDANTGRRSTTIVPGGTRATNGEFSALPGGVPARGSVATGTAVGTTAGSSTDFSGTPIGVGGSANGGFLVETNLGSFTSTSGFNTTAFNSGARITDDSSATV